MDLLYPKDIVETKLSKRVRVWSGIMFGAIVLQIIYGAFVAGLKAGLFYNTYPMMGHSLMPETVTSFDPFWRNFLENPAGVQFLHRNIAIVVAVLVLFVWEKSRLMELSKLQRRASNFMMSVVVIQFLLGVITLIYSVPVTMGVLHQTGAFFLFASSLFFIHSMRKTA
jgi:cytochrome c oxidase assembly protein subunit 15